MRFRSSLRFRLTAWYGVIFFAAGTILVAAAFVFVRQNVGPVRAVVYDRGAQRAQLLPQRSVDREAWRRTLDELAIVLGGLTAVSIATGWLVAGRVLRPLDQITEAVKQLSEANLAERIALRGPDDELKRLADSLDAMLARVDAVVSSHRRFIADASHELRTPLAVMRAAVEVSLMDRAASDEEREQAAATVLESVNRSDHLVQSLLALARSEAAADARVEVDLPDLVEQVLHELMPTIEQEALVVHKTLEPAVVRGDPALLRALVRNLLRNAVDYNRARGEISIAVASSGGRAELRVGNSGEVVLPEEVEELFEPFRRGRLAPGTAGAGLGLAIVRSVAERHGGTATAQALELGGLDVAVTLPLIAGDDEGESAGARRPRRRLSVGEASRSVLRLAVLTCALVVVAYGGIAGSTAGVRAALAHQSEAEANRGARAFPFAWRHMSEANLRAFAGAPTWAGQNSRCGLRMQLACAAGVRCLQYGDVDSTTSTEYCFRGGLVWKMRWQRDAWRRLVDARPLHTS